MASAGDHNKGGPSAAASTCPPLPAGDRLGGAASTSHGPRGPGGLSEAPHHQHCGEGGLKPAPPPRNSSPSRPHRSRRVPGLLPSHGRPAAPGGFSPQPPNPATAPLRRAPPQRGSPRLPRAEVLTRSFVFSIRPSWAGDARCLCPLPSARPPPPAASPCEGPGPPGQEAAWKVQPLPPPAERARLPAPEYQQHSHGASAQARRPAHRAPSLGSQLFGASSLAVPPRWAKPFGNGGGIQRQGRGWGIKAAPPPLILPSSRQVVRSELSLGRR